MLPLLCGLCRPDASIDLLSLDEQSYIRSAVQLVSRMLRSASCGVVFAGAWRVHGQSVWRSPWDRNWPTRDASNVPRDIRLDSTRVHKVAGTPGGWRPPGSRHTRAPIDCDAPGADPRRSAGFCRPDAAAAP